MQQTWTHVSYFDDASVQQLDVALDRLNEDLMQRRDHIDVTDFVAMKRRVDLLFSARGLLTEQPTATS